MSRPSLLRCLLQGALLGLALSLTLPAWGAEPLIKPGDKVVFLGDSITQAGAGPDGYISVLRKEMEHAHAGSKVELVGAGISGNRVPDLEQRLEKDVLAAKPQLVIIYIGINDVWHSQSGRGTSEADFEAGLKRVIERIRGVGSKVVLCTPSVIGEKTDGSNPLDAMLEDYAGISRRVAREAGVPLLDLRKRFIAHLRQHNEKNADKGLLTSDGVHLSGEGNVFVAKQMAAALHGENDGGKHLRHVVLFQFKADATPAQVAEIERAFARLPSKIREITGFERGTNVSPENLAQGFTHCFFLSFGSNADRDIYLKHPAHEEFVKVALPRIEKALVVDYWTE